METNSQDRMKELLRQALPPIDAGVGPGRDLWPLVLKRLDAHPATLPWFDWALLAGLLALAALFPAWIPVFLYYL
ncbi:MAG TPA: hypothetical protein VF730_04840 [Terracidiphilus sp.]